MSVGYRVRELRLAASLTQRALARRAGLADSYLSRVENSHIAPSARTLAKLARALEVPVAALLSTLEVLEPGDRCPVSLSGRCILQHSLIVRGRRPKDPEGYSREHLELLRTCNYLLHCGDADTITALKRVLSSLLVLLVDEQGDDEQRP